MEGSRVCSCLDSCFLFSVEYCSTGMDHHLCIHSPDEGHLGGFQVLAIMNKAALNTHVQVSVWT